MYAIVTKTNLDVPRSPVVVAHHRAWEGPLPKPELGQGYLLGQVNSQATSYGTPQVTEILSVADDRVSFKVVHQDVEQQVDIFLDEKPPQF